MITYKELFAVLRNPQDPPRPKNIEEGDYFRAAKMMQILCHAEIAVWNKSTATYALHPKQVLPSIIVVDIPKAKVSVPNAVHVNWSRGHSGAAYPVLAHGMLQGKRYYVVNISTDPSKVFPKHVWEVDCKAVVAKVETVVAEKAA